MEMRLLRAALWRRRGMVGLAVLAVAIGSSVAAALLHVSVDVSRKVGHELRALGPNVLLVPEQVRTGEATTAAGRFLDERIVRERLASANAEGALLLYAAGRVAGRPLQAIGTDLDAARALHPGWRIGTGDRGTLMGESLMHRLGVQPGDSLTLAIAGGSGSARLRVGAMLSTGGPDDDAWWVPLPIVQRLAGLDGRVSIAQARVEASGRSIEAAVANLGAPGLEVLPLHALTETEAGLLLRMGRLMLLVTIAAMLAGGLAAFGTLMDLALVRRREIALMKSLGARRRDIVRQFVYESLVIGAAGGALGWAIGVVFAIIIGRQVFHASIALHPGVPMFVMTLAIVVAVLAGLGPIRVALGVEPAGALKGD
jgi:putative ABC transport system permease protein